MEEVAFLSYKTRNLLEGAIIQLPREKEGQKLIVIRFLGCVTENNSTGMRNTEQGRFMHQYYDCIVRG
jgi:hypothetical protein